MPDDPPEDRQPPVPHGTAEVEELVLRHARYLKDPQRREEGAELLHAHYAGRLRAFFRKRRVGDEDAAELIQDTFVRFFRADARFESRGELERYLFQIAKNAFFNFVRDRGAVKRSAPEEPLENWLERRPEGAPPRTSSPGRAGLAAVLEEEQRIEVAKALRTLPPAMGKCMVLRLFHDMTYREIADFLGIQIGTVKAHLHQGRSRLESLLAPYFGKGGPRSSGEAGV